MSSHPEVHHEAPHGAPGTTETKNGALELISKGISSITSGVQTAFKKWGYALGALFIMAANEGNIGSSISNNHDNHTSSAHTAPAHGNGHAETHAPAHH